MKLIFVYNADSGIVNTVKDIGHKLFSPSTYGCLLCSLTHGTFRENDEWKRFRNSSTTEMLFLHRDEFEQRYDYSTEYPVVLQETEKLEVVLSREQMADFSTLQDLIAAIRRLEAAAAE